MRRRTRIDLGQKALPKEEAANDRKRQRWADRNKDKPEENPFLKLIKPSQPNFGDPDENKSELRKRLDNLEFGNFPGYFNYRKKAAETKCNNANVEVNKSKCDNDHPKPTPSACHDDLGGPKENPEVQSEVEGPLSCGLSDERLSHMKLEWFSGKNVLDIGCNRGHVTYAIARLFSPNSIVGIDIDLKMIQMANRDLHHHLEGSEGLLSEANDLRLKRAASLFQDACSNDDSHRTQFIEDPSQFPLSSYIANGPIAIGAIDDYSSAAHPVSHDVNEHDGATSAVNGDNIFKSDERKQRFPNNIVFVEHNYVLARDELVEKQKAHFDTIVCLSVTKWIHLNYRDDGLKRFFKRVYNHLKPGGLLILEAQPFDNYSRRKKLSDRMKSNFYSIKFKPDQFDAHLLSEQVGFKEIIYETVGKHECSGFQRPFKVFLK